MGKRKVFDLADLVSKLEDKPVKYLKTGLVPLDLVFGGRGIGLGAMYQFYSGSGYGKCVPAGTRIATSDGYVPIESLVPNPKEGFQEFSGEAWDGKAFRPIKRFYHERGCQVYHLHLSDGTVVSGTARHPIQTHVHGVCLKPIGEFKVGDPVLKDHSVIPSGGPCPWSVDEFYALGLWLGDGHREKGSGSYGFTAKSYEKACVFSQALGGDWPPRKYPSTSTWSVPFSRRKGTCGGVEPRNIIIHFFPNPVNSFTKYIPSKVFKASLQHRVAFLRGLIDTDGHVGSCFVDIAMRSKAIISGVVHLAETLGLQVYTKVTQVPPNKDSEPLPLYRVFLKESYPGAFEVFNHYKGWKTICGKVESPNDHNTFRLTNSERDALHKHLVFCATGFRRGNRYIPKRNTDFGSPSWAWRAIGRNLVHDGAITERSIMGLLDLAGMEEQGLSFKLSEFRGKSEVYVTAITETVEDVYDVEMDTPEHVFYAQGCINHNTTSMFSAAKTMADQGLKSLIMLSERSDQLAVDMGLKHEPYCDLVKTVPFSTYRELEQWSHSFMASDYTALWIDSITACVPSKLISDDISVEDSTPGLNAGIRQNYLRVFQSLIHDTDKVIFYINQTRANWDAGWNGEAEVAEGGYANKFFADCQFTMRGAKSIPDLVYDKKVIARQGHMLAPTKNRFALHGVKIPIQVIFGKGISNFYTLTHYLYWKGAIKVRGSWFDITFNGETAQVQGRVGRSQWVKDNYLVVTEAFYQDAPDYFVALSNGFDVQV